MNVAILKKKEGFTIIEVVLVLAIVALILLMIFIALPALQRGQRDTARKNDVGTAASAVNSFVSNNRGSFPGDATSSALTAGSLSGYLGELSSNTTLYTVRNTASTTAAPADGTVMITKATKCNAPNGTTSYTLTTGSTVTSRQYTVVMKLETANGVYFCQDS